MGNPHLHFIVRMKRVAELFCEESWCLFIFGYGYLQSGEDKDYC